MSVKNIFYSALFFLLLTSCGSVSKVIVIGAQDATQNNSLKDKNYKIVVVDKFKLADDFKSSLNDEEQKKDLPSKYMNLVYASLTSNLAKKEIKVMSSAQVTPKDKSNAVLLTGEIREFEDGNSFLRALIGFAAGRGRFDCDLILVDMNTQKKVGIIEVRKASWLLGGPIAQNHDATALMHMSLDGVSANIIESISVN